MDTIIRILDLLSYLFKFSYTAVFFLAVSTFIRPRPNRFVKILACFFLILIVPVVIYLNDAVNMLTALVLFIAYIAIFHTGKWPKKAAAILIFYPILITVNFLLQSLSSDLFFAISHAPNPVLNSNGLIINWDARTKLLSSAIWLSTQAARLLFWSGVLLFLRRYKSDITSEKIENRTWLIADSIMLISTVSVLTAIYFISSAHSIVYPLCAAAMIAGLCGILLIAYMSRSERSFREMQRLQMQHAYYMEKQKDEERIRAIYHDMKNHLLVLEEQAGTSESVQTAEKLREQIAVYEDYLHTGNDILDIILKEKSCRAREMRIDFSASADLSGLESIEPLDLSTIFGNGLDNAIEASEKLPEDQRVILLKAGRVQNFLSVIIENNCLENRNPRKGTSKEDEFLHGFGLSNMKKTAEKYGGQCIAGCKNGKFILKILIPVL